MSDVVLQILPDFETDPELRLLTSCVRLGVIISCFCEYGGFEGETVMYKPTSLYYMSQTPTLNPRS